MLQTAEDKGVIVCDTRGRVLYCNEIARDLCSPLGQVDGVPLLVEGIGDRAWPVPGRLALGLFAGGGAASFVGHALSNPDALAESCNVGVSSRAVTLDQGNPGLLITLEPRDRRRAALERAAEGAFCPHRSGDRGTRPGDGRWDQQRRSPRRCSSPNVRLRNTCIASRPRSGHALVRP